MVYHKMPPELWMIVGEMLNRGIAERQDGSIDLVILHPVRYEIIIDCEGNITDIRECIIQ